tara:strand:- start:3 stop:665 length:663 start_codon:yes stop_codon:yes gene_type:complete
MQQYELEIIDNELERKERKKNYAKEYYKAYYKISKNKLKRNEVMRKYRQKPEVKEKINLQRKKYNQSPEAKEAARKYRQKPEVKQRRNRAKEARRKIIRKVESFKDITRQWASLKRQRLIADTKRRKNLNNISVKLTPEDILDLIPKDLKCPIYKVPFVFNINSPWNLSFDRIDNNKEYTKDNVVVVSVKANTIKNTATSKELYKIADFYYELEKKLLDK